MHGNSDTDVIIKKDVQSHQQPDGTVVTTTTVTKARSIAEDSYDYDYEFGWGADFDSLNCGYCCSLPGLLRVLEIMVGFVIVGCVSGPLGIGPFFGQLGGLTYVLVVACVCICVTFVFLVVFLFGFHHSIMRDVPWRTMDLIFSVCAVVFFLIAGIVMSWYASGSWRDRECILTREIVGRPECVDLAPWIAAAVFCFINMILYILSAFFATQRSYYKPIEKRIIEVR